jgi:hypothetical protein
MRMRRYEHGRLENKLYATVNNSNDLMKLLGRKRF